MERRRLDNKWRYFYALLIAIFLFIFGFLISYSMNIFEFQRVSALQDDIFYDFYETQLSTAFFDSNVCNKTEIIDNLGESLDFQGVMLENIEQKVGKNDPRIIERKKYYTLIQLSHFEFMKKMNENCDKNKTFILFFYSNDEKYIDKSERIGKVLGHFKSNNPSVFVYSFSSDSTEPLMLNLKEKYQIEDPVFVIIDEKARFSDVENIEDLEKYL